MEELKRDLGYWLYLDIDNNDYLNKLYCKLVFQYTNSLLKQEYYLEDKEICHLQRFADILSKSNDVKKSSFHKNISQNIVCILNKLYPDNELNNIYMVKKFEFLGRNVKARSEQHFVDSVSDHEKRAADAAPCV